MRYLRRAARWVTIPGLGASDLYLINDTFTTDRAAGTVNDTSAEPGPGRRFVVDTNGKLSLSGGYATFATGGVTGGDPTIAYSALERVPGRLVVAEVLYDALIGFQIGFEDTGLVGNNLIAINASSVNMRVANASVTIIVAAIASGTTYQMSIALRGSGYFAFVRGGIFTNWTMIWPWSNDSTSPLHPRFGVNSPTNSWRCGHFRVPSARWLPSPLLSDGFSAWGTSDGLGHAEGIAGGLGTGGGGLAWTNQIGTFGATGGVAAASALSGGVAVATVDTGKADTIVTVKVTRSAGVAGALVAYVDASNLIRLVHNGTNAQLIKRVAGVDTNVISVAATYAAGAEIRASREGTAYRLYYNNAAVGSQQTISDAVFTGITQQGLYTTDVANTLDDFTIYARGTGGEYAALDNF